MALFPGVAQKIINVWNGSNLRLDDYAVPDGNALLSCNATFIHGSVGTRLGHSVVFTDSAHGAVTSMYHWFFVLPGSPAQQLSILMYYAPSTGLLGWEQYPTPGFTSFSIPTTGAAGASCVGTGLRLYAAFYDAGGKLSSHSGQVYGYNVGLDNLFAAPIQNAIAAAETGAGLCTAGAHRIGYIFTTRNGYTGKLCPVDSGGKFTPITFTSTGSKNIQLTISGALPGAGYLGSPATFQIVMATVANPNTYYAVPGAVGNCANPTVITISISDFDLAATGTDLSQNQNLLASSVGGTPPFFPSNIFTYSSRMAYVTIDGAGFPVTYFSEQNAFQYITADQHGIYLEGNAQAIVGFSLRGVCYLGTQTAFYSIEDSGDVPVKWTPAQKVDGSIGVLSPTCITVNPSLGYAAIAADRGFYIFQGGIFPALPLSYYQQPDWGRINWMIPTQVQVVDDQLNKRFIVIAPLNTQVASAVSAGVNIWTITTTDKPHLYPQSIAVMINELGPGVIAVTGPNTFLFASVSQPVVGATIRPQSSTHQLTWDYTEGDTPETIKYSLNSMGSSQATGFGYSPGAVAVVQNLPKALQEVWYAPYNESFGGAFIRQNDGTELLPYRDVTMDGVTPTAINLIYETNLTPGLADGSMTMHFFHGMHFRAFGVGGLSFLANGLDGSPSVVPAQSPLTISQTPGQEYLVTWFLMSEQQSIRFSTNAVDQWAEMSLIRAYYTETFAMR